jgi:poly-beta-hydroxyalkanoate depolymerase
MVQRSKYAHIVVYREAESHDRRHKWGKMLYSAFQAWSDMMLPSRWAARAALKWRDTCLGSWGDEKFPRRFFALLDIFQSAKITHDRPPYAIESVLCGNSLEQVREEVVADLPFCALLHFAKDGVRTPQPKMLVVAPLSGHFAT